MAAIVRRAAAAAEAPAAAAGGGTLGITYAPAPGNNFGTVQVLGSGYPDAARGSYVTLYRPNGSSVLVVAPPSGNLPDGQSVGSQLLSGSYPTTLVELYVADTTYACSGTNPAKIWVRESGAWVESTNLPLNTNRHPSFFELGGQVWALTRYGLYTRTPGTAQNTWALAEAIAEASTPRMLVADTVAYNTRDGSWANSFRLEADGTYTETTGLPAANTINGVINWAGTRAVVGGIYTADIYTIDGGTVWSLCTTDVLKTPARYSARRPVAVDDAGCVYLLASVAAATEQTGVQAIVAHNFTTGTTVEHTLPMLASGSWATPSYNFNNDAFVSTSGGVKMVLTANGQPATVEVPRPA